jgi:hypothetical protein
LIFIISKIRLFLFVCLCAFLTVATNGVSIGVSIAIKIQAGRAGKPSDKKLKSAQGSSVKRREMYAMVRASGHRKTGQLSWVFSYRLGGRGSKLERLTLGRYPDLSLKAAREKGKVSPVVGWWS